MAQKSTINRTEQNISPRKVHHTIGQKKLKKMKRNKIPKKMKSVERKEIGPVKVIIVGHGNRGTIYGRYSLEQPDKCKVVAVVVQRQVSKEIAMRTYSLSPDMIFSDWKAVANREKFADAVFICTPVSNLWVKQNLKFKFIYYFCLGQIARRTSNCIRKQGLPYTL